MKEVILLTDTFNKVVISRHKTVLAAERARRRHLKAVRRANGRDSYLSYSITSNTRPFLGEEFDAACEILDNEL